MGNKALLAVAALSAAALWGCTREALPSGDAVEITIEATMAENGETKTVLQDGTTSVLWEPGDEVKLFFDGTGSRFANQYSENSGTAKFSGSLNAVFLSNEGFSDSTPLWGLYPYRSDATSDNVSVTTTLPAEQTGRAGSFAKGTFITLAKSQSLKMGFYNVCGGVRFSLTQPGIKEVVFQGQNDEDIAGKIKLAFVDGVPAVQEVTEGQKSITLTAPGGTFETGKWYYMVAIPGTLSNGFKMTFNTAEEYAVRKSSRSVTIKRGVFGSLEDVDEGLIFIEKGEPEPGDGNIVFKDLAAKYACVDKYDTNGDGEVSYEEAEAATSFSGLFTNWKGVESFDEISYFKNVTSISGVFDGCSKLVSITVPENITSLGTYAFRGCSSLTSVMLPSNITSIGNYTFQNCSKLASVTIPSKVTSLGQYAFSGCSSLTSIDLPSGITSLGNYAFSGCSNLASVGLPSSLTTIGSYAFQNCRKLASIDLPLSLRTISQYAFSGCSSLASITIPDSVTSLGTYLFYNCTSLATANIPSGATSIPQSCFSGCSSLNSVTIPEGVTSIGASAFSGASMWKLALPPTVTSLGSSCFGSIICVVVPSTSAVTIQSNTFSDTQAIYVPSNMIERYKLMTNWTQYSGKLHPIDSYREESSFTLGTSGAVDMGLSVKWAAYNVGATKPEEYGGYYQWAGTTDVTSKSINLSWSNCPYHTGSSYSSGWTKYVPIDNASYWSGAGDPDNKTVLDLDDDVSHVKWGGAWRMPTDAEFTELRENCMWIWTTYEGTKGYMVYSFEAGYKIFLPAAGERHSTSLDGALTKGLYWSSSLDVKNVGYAWSVYFSMDSITKDYGSYGRYGGQSVRPVSE